MKKWTLSFAACLLLFSTASPVAAISDVDPDYRFYDEIQYLLDADIIQGYPDGTFQPNDTITRAEAAIMIGRMIGLDGLQRATPFPDVSFAMKASGFIASAAELDIINGYGDGTFRPGEPVTRGDMAILLAGALDLTYGASPDFRDVHPGMAAFDEIASMVLYFITQGYPDDTFRPYQPITRGELSAFIARALEPRFKNETLREDSFVPDMTKTYTYKLDEGNETAARTYKKGPEFSGESLGFVWASESGDGSESYYFLFDSEDQLIFMTPTYYGGPSLVYPPELGKTFTYVDAGNSYTLQYTGVDVTVATPYRTFTNAVEITYSFGEKAYFVPGYGEVKSVGPDGYVRSVLVDVE